MKKEKRSSPDAPAARGGWSRYRTIVISVGLFLVFDLGVLILNFTLSSQIEADAVAVNLAGRQRMLSQRTVKTLLLTQDAWRNELDTKPPLEELKLTVLLFDSTLHAFDRGGQVTGADGKPAMLAAAQPGSGREAVTQGLALWVPYKQLIDTAILEDGLDGVALGQAVDYGRANNLALLKLMNDLTVALEKGAAARAEDLRLIQVGGISLALINFVIILFHFIRKLGESDRHIEAARRETVEILDTVNEGLFLLGPDGRIGGQLSASLPRILRRAVKPGDDFFALLKDMVSESTLRTARGYVELLFAGRVKENLVGDLNPLNRLEIQVESATGSGRETRYLDFQINRVLADGMISHLLVTVSDITDMVQLQEALEAAKHRAGSEVGLLMSALSVHPAELAGFLHKTEAELLRINEQLKQKHAGPVQHQQTVQGVFRSIHAIKGEAAALGLESVELLAHDFEQTLSTLRERNSIAGDDMLSLPVHLNRLFEHLSLMKGIVDRVAGLQGAMVGAGQPGDAGESLARDLQKLADRIAQVQQKHVRVEAELGEFARLPEAARSVLKDVAIQLVRNAVYHGIEPPNDRVHAAKPEHGSIRVALHPSGTGMFEFIVRDDGRGLQPQRIREALIASGRYRLEDVSALDERTVVMKIFEPGFSTASGDADRDAGRGVGLDVVKERLAGLRAQLKVATQPGRFTEFRIQLAA
ncbi:MAG: chemotaxis protein CheA [Gammaproteobacteria bacterium]|nr:MAG: chemotaxis protein CheA [Gammaproteobacteria bacterium]